MKKPRIIFFLAVCISTALLFQNCGGFSVLGFSVNNLLSESIQNSSNSDSSAGSVGGGDGSGGASGVSTGSDASQASTQRLLYVSTTGSDSNAGSESAPFLTIQKALSVARGHRTAGFDVQVVLRAGTYRINETLNIDGGLSGASSSRPFIIRSRANERATISGSVDFSSGWTLLSSGIYTKSVASDLIVRDLVSKSGRIYRGRFPNIELWQGLQAPTLQWTQNQFYQMTTRTTFGSLPVLSDGAINSLSQQNVELVAPIAWSLSRLKLVAAAKSGDTLFLSPRNYEGSLEYRRSQLYGYYGIQHFFLEGHPEFVDQIGEWAHDKVNSRIILRSLSTPTDIERPSLANLIRISGATNISLQDITLEGTSFNAPEVHGYVSDNSACYMTWVGTNVTSCFANEVSAALLINSNSSGINVQNTRFQHLAGTAISIKASHSITIANSAFSQMGGSGVHATDVHKLNITGSSFNDVGLPYAANAVTVETSQLGQQSIRIENNNFLFLGARAIYLIQPINFIFPSALPSDASVISGNVIDNALNIIQDAGAINVGLVSGLSISANTIRNVYNRNWNENAGFTNAIYLDVATYRSSVSNNSISNAEVGIQLNCQARNTLSANTFANLTSQPTTTTNIFCLEALVGATAAQRQAMQNVLACGDITCP